MLFNICTNWGNGAGLDRDGKILQELLESFGHSVRRIRFNVVEDRGLADVNIFIETIKHDLIPYSQSNWYCCNPEWFGTHYFPVVARFTGIIAKTRDCERICRGMYGTCGPKVIYSSWESPDLYDAAIPRQHEWLHVAGNSQTKNTPAVLTAWRTGRIPAKLTVLSRWYSDPGIPNVRVLPRVSDEEHKMLMNTCRYHVAPSQYEGFGHSLNEALGCGGLVVSLDAPPMNEFGVARDLLVRSVGTSRYNNGTLHLADPDHIVNAAHAAMNLPEDVKAYTSRVNREGFLERREFFHQTIAGLWGQK